MTKHRGNPKKKFPKRKVESRVSIIERNNDDIYLNSHYTLEARGQKPPKY
jgi:hypothetical protein